MAQQRVVVGDLEQLMQQPRVAEIKLRSLHLALEQVGVQGLEQPDHEHAGEQIEIAAAGGLVDPKGTGQFGTVPDLTMEMGKHCPEPLQRGCRHPHSQLGKITLEQGADEVAAPDQAVVVAAGKKRAGEAAAQPQGGCGVQTDFRQGETFHLDDLNPSRQRFRRLAQQRRRR